MNKKLLTTIGIIGIFAGSICLYLGGGSEGYGLEIVGGAFAIVGIVVAIIKKGV